jgi:hypothetical protein
MRTVGPSGRRQEGPSVALQTLAGPSRAGPAAWQTRVLRDHGDGVLHAVTAVGGTVTGVRQAATAVGSGVTAVGRAPVTARLPAALRILRTAALRILRTAALRILRTAALRILRTAALRILRPAR